MEGLGSLIREEGHDLDSLETLALFVTSCMRFVLCASPSSLVNWSNNRKSSKGCGKN